MPNLKFPGRRHWHWQELPGYPNLKFSGRRELPGGATSRRCRRQAGSRTARQPEPGSAVRRDGSLVPSPAGFPGRNGKIYHNLQPSATNV